MSNFFYSPLEQLPLTSRFDATLDFSDGYSVVGLNEWRSLIARLLNYLAIESGQLNDVGQSIRTQTWNELLELAGNRNFSIYDQQELMQIRRSTEELIATVLLLRLRTYPPLPKTNCPRLFVSHRQADENYALRIAELAALNGFAYWIDVLDPNLKSLTVSQIPEKLIPLITACIIEMALINCTHVIACMTPNSRGTLWIPYEYGRISELPGPSINTCAWLEPNLKFTDFPEYMLLGEITKNELEIESWLKDELNLSGKKYCKPMQDDLSVFGKTDKLPFKTDIEVDAETESLEKWYRAGCPVDHAVLYSRALTFRKRTK